MMYTDLPTKPVYFYLPFCRGCEHKFPPSEDSHAGCQVCTSCLQASAALLMRGPGGGGSSSESGGGPTPALAGGPSQQQRQLGSASTIALFEDVYQRQQQGAAGAHGCIVESQQSGQWLNPAGCTKFA